MVPNRGGLQGGLPPYTPRDHAGNTSAPAGNSTAGVLGRPREAQKRGAPPLPDAAVSAMVASMQQAVSQDGVVSPAVVGVDAPQQSALNAALTNLADLTAWKRGNQHGVVDLNGLTTLLALLRQAVRAARHGGAAAVQPPAAEPSAETLALVLWVLMNLAANEWLAPRIAAEPGCIADLTALLRAAPASANGSASPGPALRPSPPAGVFAARCLVNLTHSNPVAKEVAIKAGAAAIAAELLLTSVGDEGVIKVHAWLLASLSSSPGSSACPAVAANGPLLARLLSLLECTQTAAVPTAVLAARTLGAVARGGRACQGSLLDAGAAPKLLDCLASPAAKDPKLAAAVMEAVAALSLDYPRAIGALLTCGRLAQCVQSILESVAASAVPLQQPSWCKETCDGMRAPGPSSLTRINAPPPPCTQETCDGGRAPGPDDGRCLLSAHLLVFVLAYGLHRRAGHAALPGGAAAGGQLQQQQQLRGSSAVSGVSAASGVSGGGARGASGSGSSGAPPPAPIPPAALYMSLEDAARLVGVRLPACTVDGPQAPPSDGTSDMLPKAASGGIHGLMQGAAASLAPMEVAELLHTIHDVLLPRLREPNLNTACNAVAQLYQMAAGGGPPAHAAACCQLLSEAGLVQQLVALLGSRDAPLVTSVLCLVDVLSGHSTARLLLMEAGWLDALVPLLGSTDIVVHLMAERSLCSMHLQH
ncbi:hypothetical protein FOA52_010392 [Chlamydomonas sp. UWO 241]|nr:hypothetical protein FOA52_010392 [Chlamydomonas sp. UWO 241]